MGNVESEATKMIEFYVAAKRTREDIERALGGDSSAGLIIAQFTAEENEGRRIARQIAEHWLDRFFRGEWEDLNNGQYRLKDDYVGVAVNINEYEVNP